MVDTSALTSFLETGGNWEKLESDIPGVFVVKVPATKTRGPLLMCEVNPIDGETGKPKKRKGLFVADFEMYMQFLDALENDKVANLIKILDGLNPDRKAKSNKKIKL